MNTHTTVSHRGIAVIGHKSAQHTATELQNQLIEQALADTHDGPQFFYDPTIARFQVQSFHRHLPGIEPYFAVKCCDDPEVIGAIDDVVSGYDIASLGECEQLLSRGVEPSRLLFSNPVKIPAQIERAYQLGVRMYAADSMSEVEKLATHAPGASVYFRISVSNKGSQFPLSGKFGMPPSDVISLAVHAQKRGLVAVGVTFHVGSQCENPKAWRAALSVAGTLIRQAHAQSLRFNFLNIGGGLPAHYHNNVPALRQFAGIITTAINELIPPSVRVVAEPGRFIAAPAGVLRATVIGRTQRAEREWLHLDVGTFSGIIEPLEMPGWQLPLYTSARFAADPLVDFVLTGPTCDPHDTLSLHQPLPHSIAIGDHVVIAEMGAYGRVYASAFNGFEIPDVSYVKAAAEAGSVGD